jgi:hypothetical protein
MSPSARHVSTSSAGEPDEQRREFHARRRPLYWIDRIPQ